MTRCKVRYGEIKAMINLKLIIGGYKWFKSNSVQIKVWLGSVMHDDVM